MTTDTADLTGLDFTHVTECIDPAHTTDHDPFTTATWLVRERACRQRVDLVDGMWKPLPQCPGATLLLCADGYDAYRAAQVRTCPRCGQSGPPSTWIEQATPIASQPGYDTLMCPVDRATFASPTGTRPWLRVDWRNHHTHQEATP